MLAQVSTAQLAVAATGETKGTPGGPVPDDEANANIHDEPMIALWKTRGRPTTPS
jgi:hypothetical protein